MAVSPPFAIAETLPADSDIISIFPTQEHSFRDTVESWLAFLSDPATGLLRSTVFPFPLSIANAGAGLFLSLESSDAGSTLGPSIDLYRNSASPAALDSMGTIRFQGKNSAGVKTQYATVFASIADATSGSEDGVLNLKITVAGVSTDRIVADVTGVAISGNLTVSSTIVATSGITAGGNLTALQNFQSSTATAIFATTGAGTILFRPNGVGSGTNQAVITSAGQMTVTGTFDAGGAISSSAGLSGTTGTFSGAVTAASLDAAGEIEAAHFVSVSRVFANATAGTMNLRPFGSGSSTGQMTITAAGVVTASGDITANSDRRLKKSISTLGLEAAIEAVQNIPPVTFIHKKNDRRGIGFVAQDVQNYIPEVVHEADNGTLSLAYPNMVAVLWRVVQDLQERVKELEAVE